MMRGWIVLSLICIGALGDANISPDSAINLPLGTTQLLRNVSETRAIYYKFEAPQAGLVSIEISLILDGYIQLDLNQNSSFLGTISVGSPEKKKVLTSPIGPGPALLYIPATNFANNFNFTITIEITTCSRNSTISSTPNGAPSISLGELDGVFCFDEPNVQYYSFTPLQSGILSYLVQVDQSKGLGSFAFSILYPNESVICSQTTAGSPVYCIAPVFISNTYLIKIQALGQGIGTYRILLSLEPCIPDEFEPNPGFDQFTLIEPDGRSYGGSLCGGDHDFFKLSSKTAQNLFVRLEIDGDSTTFIRLYQDQVEKVFSAKTSRIHRFEYGFNEFSSWFIEINSSPYVSSYQIQFAVGLKAELILIPFFSLNCTEELQEDIFSALGQALGSDKIVSTNYSCETQFIQLSFLVLSDLVQDAEGLLLTLQGKIEKSQTPEFAPLGLQPQSLKLGFELPQTTSSAPSIPSNPATTAGPSTTSSPGSKDENGGSKAIAHLCMAMIAILFMAL